MPDKKLYNLAQCMNTCHLQLRTLGNHRLKGQKLGDNYSSRALLSKSCCMLLLCR